MRSIPQAENEAQLLIEAAGRANSTGAVIIAVGGALVIALFAIASEIKKVTE